MPLPRKPEGPLDRGSPAEVLDEIEAHGPPASDAGAPHTDSPPRSPVQETTTIPFTSSDGLQNHLRLYASADSEELVGCQPSMAAFGECFAMFTISVENLILLVRGTGCHDSDIDIADSKSRRGVSLLEEIARIVRAQVSDHMERTPLAQPSLSLEGNTSSDEPYGMVAMLSQSSFGLTNTTVDGAEHIAAAEPEEESFGMNDRCTLQSSPCTGPIADVGNNTPCSEGSARSSYLAIEIGRDEEIPIWEPGSILKIWVDANSFQPGDLDYVQQSIDDAIEQWGHDMRLGLMHVNEFNDANVMVRYKDRDVGKRLANAFMPGEEPVINVYPLALGSSYRHVLSACLSHELGHVFGFRHEFARTGYLETPKERKSLLWGEKNGDSIMNYRPDWSIARVQQTDRVAIKSLYEFKGKEYKDWPIVRYPLRTLSERGIARTGRAPSY
ncbi:zincin [Apiospora sp. TS-2023a]